MVLVPDTAAASTGSRNTYMPMGAGKTLMFAHGFNIHFGQIQLP